MLRQLSSCSSPPLLETDLCNQHWEELCSDLRQIHWQIKTKWEEAWLTKNPQGEIRYWFIFNSWCVKLFFLPRSIISKPRELKENNKNQSLVIEGIQIHFKLRLNSENLDTITSAGSDIYSSTSSTGARHWADADSLSNSFSLRSRGSTSTYLRFLEEFMLQQL